MSIDPNAPPYKRSYESITEHGDFFEKAYIDGQVIRVGDQFWHAEDHFMVEVVDVIEKIMLDNRGSEISDEDDRPVKIVLDSDDPRHNEAPDDGLRINAERFVDDLEDGVWVAHTGNGYLPPSLNM